MLSLEDPSTESNIQVSLGKAEIEGRVILQKFKTGKEENIRGYNIRLFFTSEGNSLRNYEEKKIPKLGGEKRELSLADT